MTTTDIRSSDVAQAAKLIRADIKEALPKWAPLLGLPEGVKVSTTIERGSQMSAINIRVKGAAVWSETSEDDRCPWNAAAGSPAGELGRLLFAIVRRHYREDGKMRFIEVKLEQCEGTSLDLAPMSQRWSWTNAEEAAQTAPSEPEAPRKPERAPLTLSDVNALSAIVGAAQRGARVARAWVDEPSSVVYGTARSIGDDMGNFSTQDADVRDEFLRVTTVNGWEAFWRISELMDSYKADTFLVDVTVP